MVALFVLIQFLKKMKMNTILKRQIKFENKCGFSELVFV